ncbi:MAG: fumarate hydratase, partial [Hadesarchaea archaeon]|nr:fumarate hydratase [Hadesarchaea archaeon]
EIAEKEERPICQDTGIPVFFVKLGTELDLNYDLNSVLKKAVKSATKNVPLRPNVVNPLTRENTGDNTGENQPIIHIEAFPGEKFELDLLLKGAGSENWSKLFMMKPTSSLKDVEKVIIDLIKEAGGEPCPPTIVGVGIGGSADTAGLLAKKSLLRPINEQNENEELAELENQITEKANETGIGPMGLGGKTTVLSTNILSADCHTASLPVAVNLQCWADRRARAKLINDELEIEVP